LNIASLSTIDASFFFSQRETISNLPKRCKERKKELEIMKKMEMPKDFSSWHKTAEYNLFEENYQQFGIWYLHFFFIISFSIHENVGWTSLVVLLANRVEFKKRVQCWLWNITFLVLKAT
jgi:hypothetical protein